MTKPKLAWIDHESFYSRPLRDRLEYEGIEIVLARSLEEFERMYNLNDFKVLFYHSGVVGQKKLGIIKEKYPHLKLAFITCVIEHYKNKEDGVKIFDYGNFNEEMMKFIIENQ